MNECINEWLKIEESEDCSVHHYQSKIQNVKHIQDLKRIFSNFLKVQTVTQFFRKLVFAHFLKKQIMMNITNNND